MCDADLRVAVQRGYWPLPAHGMGGVEIRGRFLRYDTALPWLVRARLVLEVMRKARDPSN